MNLDLKSGPATIICLQEAHEGVADVLAEEPAPPPPPAVAGNGGEDRPQAQYYTLRANENCNTNFIAVRVNLASELKALRFQLTLDGRYKARDGRRVAARSRINVVQVMWHKPVAGMTTTVVVNCHMHRMAAKKASGFADGYKSFFDTLAANILNSGGRCVVGDWNMSLWVVADELRQRRIECTIGAMFAWRLNSNDQVMCDSLGISCAAL